MPIGLTWRGEFTNPEVNALHAEAFGARASTEGERDWQSMVADHSLGWVTARDGAALVGFVNVIWDGLAHAWIQDTMVASGWRSRGIGAQLVATARESSRDAGCEWLHVDFADHLRAFYVQACGFAPTAAGLIRLDQPGHR
jgi:GNAT superfamily N-acetyltransferase